MTCKAQARELWPVLRNGSSSLASRGIENALIWPLARTTVCCKNILPKNGIHFRRVLSGFVQTKAFVGKKQIKTCDELKDSRKYITC